jgi:hypothetical protein
MTDTTSYIEMLRKFGADLGLPKPNVDQLVEAQKKNIEALNQGAQVIAQGAQTVAQKQRELMEAGLQEAMSFARENQGQSTRISRSRPNLRARCSKSLSREPRRPRPPRDNRAPMR